MNLRKILKVLFITLASFIFCIPVLAGPNDVQVAVKYEKLSEIMEKYKDSKNTVYITVSDVPKDKVELISSTDDGWEKVSFQGIIEADWHLYKRIIYSEEKVSIKIVRGKDKIYKLQELKGILTLPEINVKLNREKAEQEEIERQKMFEERRIQEEKEQAEREKLEKEERRKKNFKLPCGLAFGNSYEEVCECLKKNAANINFENFFEFSEYGPVHAYYNFDCEFCKFGYGGEKISKLEFEFVDDKLIFVGIGWKYDNYSRYDPPKNTISDKIFELLKEKYNLQTEFVNFYFLSGVTYELPNISLGNSGCIKWGTWPYDRLGIYNYDLYNGAIEKQNNYRKEREEKKRLEELKKKQEALDSL